MESAVPREKSILLQLCTENVYKDNVFHLLGLPTLATLRQIRHRNEDLEAAHAMGDEAWVKEFAYLRGNRPVPSFDEIQTAFEHLKDPDYRLVSEFFRVWDDGNRHVAGSDPSSDDARTILGDLESRVHSSLPESRGAVFHDIAVLRHKLAIDSELMLIHAGEYAPSIGTFRSGMHEDWDIALACWKTVAKDDGFWNDFEDRVVASGDPRLSRRLVRSMRSELPLAIAFINIRLAAKYAALGKRDDARRHMRYIRQMSDVHDGRLENEVESLFFGPVERDLDRLVGRSDRQVEESPRLGARLVRQLLQCNAKCLVEAMLPEGHGIRARVTERLVKAGNAYLVRYGNETSDWNGCLEVLGLLGALPCSSEQRKALFQNEATVKGNLEYDRLHNTCCFCKKERGVDAMAIEMKMYGNVKVQIEDQASGKYRVVYDTRSVKIPQCDRCSTALRVLRAMSGDKWFAYQKVLKGRSFWRRWLHIGDADIARLQEEYRALEKRIQEAEAYRERELRTHPLYQEAVREGYKEGTEPPSEECTRLYRAELANPYERVYGNGFVMLRPRDRR